MKPVALWQSILPHQLLSRLVRHATRWTFRPWKNFLIDTVVQLYDVDLAEAQESDPHAYRHFNAFFTRALKPGARPLAGDESTLISPADGRISQAGRIRDGRIFQAKGQDFSCAELLGDAAAAEPYAGGHFATIYLSPRDYHRVHMPLAGRLVRTTHIPGRLFSVAPAVVEAVPRLFARNERLACHFEGPQGPFVVVMVGAMLVSGVQTSWAGEIIPPYARAIRDDNFAGREVAMERGAEMARFNMGSTVIVLLPGTHAGLAELEPGQALRMGQRLDRPAASNHAGLPTM